MNINNLVLLNTLSSIINEGTTDCHYSIAEYLLHNIHRISNVSVNNIVDEAFVSRSTIRRFCNRLGYDNFSELKNSLSAIIFPSNIHLREFMDTSNYRNELKKELPKMFTDINSTVTDDIIDDLVKLIHQYDDVAIISASNTNSNLLKFQQELFYANKIVRLISIGLDNGNISETLNRNSLIISVSVSGVFANAINDMMKELSGRKILITAYRNDIFEETYDQIIYISSDKSNSKDNPFWEDKIGLYGKYGITYIFDLIAEHYIYSYMKRRGGNRE